ncbi:MAG: AmmeMemoRadiSam system protein B [Myxococcota bacterium]
MRRAPAVAGRFYPADASEVRARTEALLVSEVEPSPALALVGPHAGWMYSGALAGAAWAQVAVPRRVLVLAPNHTGMGPVQSVWGGDAWTMPTGPVAIDEELRAALVEAGVRPDRAAHVREHAIEVHVPFAVARRPDLQLTPVVLGPASVADCLELGEAIAAVVRAADEPVLIVASTDMSHYVSADVAERLDHLALTPLLARDPTALLQTVREHRISMCGVIPTAVALHAANALGATEATLCGYTHSGRVSGDYDRVVGYAAAVVR